MTHEERLAWFASATPQQIAKAESVMDILTLCRRVIELDRLYLRWDRLALAEIAAGRSKRRDNLRRRARAAWRDYKKLRDEGEKP